MESYLSYLIIGGGIIGLIAIGFLVKSVFKSSESKGAFKDYNRVKHQSSIFLKK